MIGGGAPWSGGSRRARHPGGPGSKPAYSSYFSDFEEQLENRSLSRINSIAKVRMNGRNRGRVVER